MAEVHKLPGGRPALSRLLPAACLALLAGCAGPQSALDPAGRTAERISHLFWWMTGVAGIVWIAVVLLAIYAVRKPAGTDRRSAANKLIFAGAVTPAVVLCCLLAYGLAMLREVLAPVPEGSLRIRVYGEQWWWRIRYEPPGRQPFELANEVRLPVGQPVEFLLHSHNVIHSFWIPSLGGKVDLIPGRVNRLALHPTKTGVFRGVCAEYCGIAHAHMAFHAIVVPKDEFVRWLEKESKPAAVQQVSQ
jgi:cytochrome c oxidase subunit 2